jgi:hypothetical protein
LALQEVGVKIHLAAEIGELDMRLLANLPGAPVAQFSTLISSIWYFTQGQFAAGGTKLRSIDEIFFMFASTDMCAKCERVSTRSAMKTICILGI